MKSKKNMTLLIISRSTTSFGKALLFVTLTWYAAELTNSATLVSLLSSARMLSGLLFSVFIGVFIDKFDKRKTWIIVDLCRSGLMIFLLILYLLNLMNIWWLIFVVFMNAIIDNSKTTLSTSAIPSFVGEDNLQESNSKITTGENAFQFVGNLLSGIAYYSFGILLSTIANFFTSILSAFVISKTKVEQKKITNDNFGVSVIEDIKYGFKYFFSQKRLIILLTMSISGSIMLSSSGLLALYVRQIFNTSSTVYGFMEGADALGGVVGALLLSKVKINKLIRFTSASSIVLGVLYALQGFMPNVILLTIVIFFFGATLSWFNISYITEFQNRIDESVRGRVLSMSYMITTIIYPISSMLSGIAADRFGIARVWGVMGLTHLIIILILFNLVRKEDYN